MCRVLAMPGVLGLPGGHDVPSELHGVHVGLDVPGVGEDEGRDRRKRKLRRGRLVGLRFGVQK